MVSKQIRIKEKILKAPKPLSINNIQIAKLKTAEKIKNLKIKFKVNRTAKNSGVKNAKNWKAEIEEKLSG